MAESGFNLDTFKVERGIKTDGVAFLKAMELGLFSRETVRLLGKLEIAPNMDRKEIESRLRAALEDSKGEKGKIQDLAQDEVREVAVNFTPAKDEPVAGFIGVDAEILKEVEKTHYECAILCYRHKAVEVIDWCKALRPDERVENDPK